MRRVTEAVSKPGGRRRRGPATPVPEPGRRRSGRGNHPVPDGQAVKGQPTLCRNRTADDTVEGQPDVGAGRRAAADDGDG